MLFPHKQLTILFALAVAYNSSLPGSGFDSEATAVAEGELVVVLFFVDAGELGGGEDESARFPGRGGGSILVMCCGNVRS